MPQIFLSDDARTTLASSINNVATSLSVAAGKGALFPVVVAGSGDYFRITLKNASGAIERVKVTEHQAGDSFQQIVRAEEGTTALSWNTGDIVALRGTAAVHEELLIQTNPRPQCILVCTSAGNIRLDPFQGRHIPLYSSGRWRLRRIPSAGVALATGALGLNVTRYVYAYWTGSAVALELSATGFSTDDLTGLPHKTGDVTKLLVGAVAGNDSNVVDISGRMWGVSSYWNRVPRTIKLWNTGTQVLTGNSTFNLYGAGMSNPAAFWSWGDDAADAQAFISASHGAAYFLIPMIALNGTSQYMARYLEDGQGTNGGNSAGTFSTRINGHHGLAVGLNSVSLLYYTNANVTVSEGRASLEVAFMA